MFKWLASRLRWPIKNAEVRKLDQAVGLVLWQGDRIRSLEEQLLTERDNSGDTIATFLLRAGGKVTFSQDFINAAKLDLRKIRVSVNEAEDFVYELVNELEGDDDGDTE